MKVITSFVLLLAAVTVFASDSPPAETQQVLYLADATGGDPVRWLEGRMTTPVRPATAVEHRNEVRNSLPRFLKRHAVATTS